MPRAERPLELDGSELSEFAADLRLLRAKAGLPPYRELARAAHFSSTTLSDAASGRRLPSLDVTLAFVRACGGDTDAWDARWHTIAASIAVASASAPGDDTDSPYVGLSGYTDADADRFFGRETLVDEVTSRVSLRRFTAVFGPSGSGKSSLLRAGVISKLRRDGRQAVVVLTPGAQPLDELAAALGPLLGTSPAALREDHRNLHDGLRRNAIVLVVDQFEELFTICRDEAQRETFISALLHAAFAEGSRCRVLLGVRADFYPHCALHAELAQALGDAQVTVGPMTAKELRRVIVEPATRARCTVEGALLTTLVSEAHGRPGILPLLSHALLETWRRRAGAKLTLAAYQHTGGMARALARTAEAVHAGLTESQQRITRHLFVRLTALGEGTEDTKRRVPLTEIEQDDDHRRVIARLVEARLITADRDSVEITHEALIRNWPRLHRWLDEDRDGVRIHRALTEATGSWEALGRDPSVLYRGTRLAQVKSWHDTARAALTTRERQFLEAAVRAQEDYRAGIRRRTRRLRGLVAAVVVFALFAVAATIVAAGERSTALKQRDDAMFSQVVAEADWLSDRDPALSAQLKLVAHQLRPGQAGVDSRLLGTQNIPLPKVLTGHSGNVYLTSFSPDGRTLASVSDDDTVRLWDLHDQTAPVSLAVLPGGQHGWGSAGVFSPRGDVLATTGKAGTIQLWNVADPAHPVGFGPALPGNDGSSYLLAFSPNGRLLATANDNKTVRLWDVADPAHPASVAVLTGHTGPVRSVAFSADGRLLASGGDDTTVRLWNVGDPARPVPVGSPLTGHSMLVHSVAFSAGGKIVASGSQDNTVRLWDTETGEPVGVPLIGHTSGVWSVVFNHDGTVLASGSADGTARLWNMADPTRPAELGQSVGGGDLYTVAFNPDGTTLATGSSDGLVRLWSLPTAILLGHRTTVNSVAFRRDGRLIATGALDGTARLWDTTDPAHPVPAGTVPAPAGQLASCSGSCTHVQISPDGRLLAVLSYAKIISLWNIADQAHPRAAGPPLTLRTRFGAALSFSPDGRTLATADDENAVQLWDVTVPEHPTVVARIDGDIGGNSLTFSPDGRLLATVGVDHTIRLWNVTERTRPRPADVLRGHTNNVVSVAFAPDSRTVAGAGADQTVRLWDVDKAGRTTRSATVLTGHTRSVSSVAFSPDGRTLASGSTDKTLRLWDLTDRLNPTPLGEPMTAVTSRGAGLTFSPDSRFLAVTDDGNAVRLITLDVDEVIRRICATTQSPSRDQWTSALPMLPYRPPCKH
jgi:WD40 repeat protein/transcriptional regulator with XRE-family HTH domain